MQEKFLKELKYVNEYINIKKSRMHKVSCRYLVMPCVEAIEWFITHMDDFHLVLCSESGSDIATYYGDDMQTYYKMIKPTKYENDNFYMRWAINI